LFNTTTFNTTTERPMHGEPSFFEIGVVDAGRAKAFYGRLFAWTFHPMAGEQAWVETPTIRGGLHDGDPDRRIDVFFTVDDIDSAVAAVRELGGHADEPGPEESGFGRFAFCRDDQGVRFGLHQPPTA
jgi:predicted enzyme related to lactoylglutathione lyase